jgi:hypothetical protein
MGRRGLHQPRQYHLWLLRSVEDRLDDICREQGQSQDAGHLGRRDPLAVGQFVDGRESARFEHTFLSAKGEDQRLYPRAVGAAQQLGTIRHLHLLAAVALMISGLVMK